MNHTQRIAVWLPYNNRRHERPRGGGNRIVRLFCFPHAGAGASVFLNWRSLLPAEIELCPVQLPGRESRLKEAPISDAQHMAEQVVAELNGMWDCPFALLGHSYGSVLAFEIGRRLCHREDLPLLRVFASGRHAPHLPEPHPIHFLPDLLFLREIQQLNGTMLNLLDDAALRDIFLPGLRADYTASETYLCDASKAMLTCPLSVFGGRSDASVSETELKAWSRLTMATFRLRMFPGDHFFLYNASETILQAICEDLLEGES